MSRLARLAGDRRGGVAVEMAFLLPILLLLLLGVMEFGRMAWTKATLTYAVQEAGRCASVLATCSTPAQVQKAARDKTAALNIADADITITALQNTTGPACSWRISATVTRGFILKKLPDIPTPVITAQVCRP
jgi:Flp pilus assembly protein TadG